MRQLILFLLLLNTPAFSQVVLQNATIQSANFGASGGGGGGGGCTTIADGYENLPPDGDTGLGQYESWQYWSTKWVATSNFTACGIAGYAKKAGTGGSGSVTFAIYSNNAGQPGTQLGIWDSAKAGSTFPTSFEWVTNSLASTVSISGGTTYWIVAHCNAYDTVNFVNISSRNPDAGGDRHSSADGSTWTHEDTEYFSFRVFK